MRGDGQFHLGPPAAEEFEQMIRLPARAAGLNFEVNEDGIGLDAVLREAASAHPNILPLLSFTMQELYARRVEENTLCFSAYDKLGGIEGAITRQAHETYEKLPPACQRELAAVLGSLITINADDAETAGARSASWDYIAESPRREQLVQAFVDARLMVVDEDDHDKTRRTVRLAHEALLTRWSKASNWIRENQEFLRARARILDSASYWALEGRAGTLLIPDGKLLDVAADLLVDRGTDLSETVIEYIAASSQASDDRRIRRQARESETKKRRVRFIAAVAGMVVAFGISGVVAYQQSVKDRELAALEVTAAERKAESEARAYVAMAEQELDDRNYLRGATLALSALRNTASIPSSLQIRAQSVLNTALRFKPRSISVGSFANFPSASDVVVTRDDGIAVQRLALDGALESVRLSQDPVFSADGDSFLAVSSDHVLGAWSTSTLTNLVEIEHDVATPIRYGFSDDQSFVYVIDGSGLQLYDASDASAEALAAQLEDEIVDAWIHTHAYAVLATKNGGVSVWHFARNAAKPLPLHLPVFDSSNRIVATMPYQAELETTHALSPSRLLTRSKSGAVKLWNAVTGEQLAHAGNGSLATVQGDFVVADGYVANRWDGNKAWIKTSYLARLPVSSIAVADKDGSVAIVDDGGSLYLWKASGDLVATTRPQYPAVSDERVSLRFDSAGNRLFLDGRGIALLIQLDDNGRLVSERIAFDQPLANNETGKTVYRSTTGELLVTDLESGATTSIALDEDLSFRSIDRAGNRIALTGDGSSVQVWSLDTKERVGQVPFKGALQRASLSASGRLLLVTTDNESRLWDLESTGEEIRFDANTTIAAADYTEPGSLVAVGTGNTLVVVNPSTDVRQSLEFAGPVVQVRFSPDGERLGVGLDGGSVHLFDAKSLETIGVLEHEGTAENLIISPGDGAIVAWSSGSDRVSVWSNASAQSAIPLAHWSPISFVTVDSSYRQLASGTDGGVVDLWDLESGAHLDRHTYGAPIERLYFGERGLVAYVDASQNVTTIVNADLGEPILTMDIAADSIATMAVSFDAESVATLLRNGDIVTWDVNTGRETGRIDTTSVLQEAARELRRARPATRDEAIESTLVQYQDIVGVSASNARLVFAPDGSRLAAQVSKESPLLMFDHVAGTLVAQTDTGLRLAGFDIDSQLLIGTGPDGASYYWSTDDGEPTESHERVQPLLLSAHPWTHRSSARIDTALPFAEALRGGQRLNDADLILDSDAAGRLLIRTRSGRIQLVDPGQKQTVALDLAGDPDIVRFASGGSHIVVIRRSEFTALPAFRGAIEAAGRALLADL
jgi:WD40 repeat protein